MKKLILCLSIMLAYSQVSYASNDVVRCAAAVLNCGQTGDTQNCIRENPFCMKVRTKKRFGPNACTKSCNRMACKKGTTPTSAACEVLANTEVDGAPICPENKVRKCLQAREMMDPAAKVKSAKSLQKFAKKNAKAQQKLNNLK